MVSFTTTSGSSPSATTLSQAAERYEFRGMTCNGRTGSIYEVEDRMHGQGGTIKLLALNLTAKRTRREFTARSQRLMRLRHPAIVPVRDYGYHYGLGYLVSDEVTGQPLDAVLRKIGPLNWDQFVPIFDALLEALEAAHSADVIHGDVQPSHIYLDSNGRYLSALRLTGFGFPDLASVDVSAAAETRHLSVVDAIAPERLLKRPCDHRLDLYAAGATAYEMLSGRVPFDGSSVQRVFQALYEPAESLKSVLPPGHGVPEEAIDLVERMLEKSPDDRPADAATVRRELRKLTRVSALRDARIAVSPGNESIGKVDIEDIAAARPKGAVVPIREEPAPIEPPIVASWLPTPQLVVQVSLVVAAFLLFAALGLFIVMQFRPDATPPPAEVVEAPAAPAEPQRDERAEIHALLHQVGRALDSQEFGKAEDLLARMASRADFPPELRGTLDAYTSRLELSSELNKARRLEASGKFEDALLIYAALAKKFPHHAQVPSEVKELDHSFVLKVDSNVRGVVSIDDEPVGVTPFVSIVPVEAKRVTVSRKGYRSWSTAVAAQEGSRLEIDASLKRRRRGERPTRREIDINASPFMDLMEMKLD